VTSEEKYAALRDALSRFGKAAVAFSGGVDSTFLSRVARDVLGDGALAVTVVSPMLPRSELRAARELAAFIGIRHVLLEDPVIEGKVAENPRDRCYHCKKIGFAGVIRAALERGITRVLDGSNADDASDYRPGAAAGAELGVLSPLRDAGLTKAEIRQLSRGLGLPTWDKPAFACLASRVPYGEPITAEKLRMVDGAEEYLRGLGLRQVRVRIHDRMARIEVAPEERGKLMDADVLDDVSARLKSFGFLYVCMELEGYRMGSMNRAIAEGGADG
jgi:pyridinium-3,5-biscarboxylic acid mononucleotide sulfurtransferase